MEEEKTDLGHPETYDSPEVHPAATLVREMTDDEFAALKADIAANGQRESIKLLDGKVLDGRNRLRVCGELGIEPRFEDVKTDDAAAYVRSLNVARRHLTTLERARVANSEATRTRADQRGPATFGTGAEGLPPTQAEAAAKFGVGVRTIRQVKAIDESGDGELIASVESGDVSIKKAAAKVALRQRAERRVREVKSPIPIEVLRSFEIIDRELVYRPGRELWTEDSSGSVRCGAVLEEELPHGGFLDDIGKLLRTLKLYRDGCDVLFEDGRITLRQGSTASQIALSAPAKEPERIMGPVDTSDHQLVGRCRMSGMRFAESVKSARVMRAPCVVLMSDTERVSVTWRAPTGVRKRDRENDLARIRTYVGKEVFAELMDGRNDEAVAELVGGTVEYNAVLRGQRLAGGGGSSWECSFAPQLIRLVDPAHNYDVAVYRKGSKGIAVFEAGQESGVMLTYWIEAEEVAAHGEASPVAADLPGRVVHLGDRHQCAVTAEVIDDQVQLTARLDDDPDRAVQVTVPWRDLARLFPE